MKVNVRYRHFFWFAICFLAYLVSLHPSAAAQTREVCYKQPCTMRGSIPACSRAITCIVCEDPSGTCGTPTGETGCTMILEPSSLLIGSVDEFDEETGEFLGTDAGAGIVTMATPTENCLILGAQPLPDGPLAAGPAISTVEIVDGFYEWPWIFQDDLDRSFVISLDDYPFIFVGGLIGVGIDAVDGTVFDNASPVELVITEVGLG